MIIKNTPFKNLPLICPACPTSCLFYPAVCPFHFACSHVLVGTLSRQPMNRLFVYIQLQYTLYTDSLFIFSCSTQCIQILCLYLVAVHILYRFFVYILLQYTFYTDSLFTLSCSTHFIQILCLNLVAVHIVYRFFVYIQLQYTLHTDSQFILSCSTHFIQILCSY